MLTRKQADYVERTKRTSADYLFYAPLVVTPIGLILNVTIIALCTRRKFHATTMGFYYTALALFDNLSLIVLFFGYFSIGVGHNLSLISNTWCKLVTYGIRLFAQFPSWIQVLITYDRILTSLFPKRVQFLQDRRILCSLIGCIVLAVGLINAGNLWFSLHSTTEVIANATDFNRTVTEVTCQAVNHVVFICDTVGASSRSVLPFSTMFIGNLFLIRCLVKSKRNLNTAITFSSGPSGFFSRREYQFALSILAMNAVFITLYLPQVITTYMAGIFAFEPSLVSPETAATANLIYTVSVYISLVNCSISFLISLAFNRIFRAEFLAAIDELKGFFVATPSRIYISHARPKSG